jgi:endoribonuclease LACTB2
VPARLLPGHGPVIDDPEALIDGYLKHRAEREAQVLEAVASGCAVVADIVDRIYTGLHPDVVRAAADSVLAHLIKLRDEGAVIESESRWRVARR